MTANPVYDNHVDKSESGISLEKIKSSNILTASFWRSGMTINNKGFIKKLTIAVKL